MQDGTNFSTIKKEGTPLDSIKDFLGFGDEEPKEDYRQQTENIAKDLEQGNLISSFTKNEDETKRNLDDEEDVKKIAKYFVDNPKFNYDEAVKDGYSSSEILDHVKQKGLGFDVNKAREDGYSDDEILNHVKGGMVGRDKLPLYVKEDGTINPYLKDVVKTDEREANKIIDEVAGNYGRELTREEKEEVFKSVRSNEDFNENDVFLGIRSVGLGVSRTYERGKNLLGITDDKEYEEVAKEYETLVEDLAHAVKDKSFFSSYTLGKIAPDVATLPISASSKMGIFLTEGALGYMSSQGEVDGDGVANTESKSALIGAMTGTLGVGAKVVLDKVINKFNGEVSGDVTKYWQKKMNFTDEQVDKIVKNYMDVTKVEDNPTNRLKAMLEHSGKQGADIKRDLTNHNSKVADVINQQVTDRVNIVTNQINKVDYTKDEFGSAMMEGFKTAKKSYRNVSEGLGGKTVDADSELHIIFENIVTENKAIKNFLYEVDVEGSSIPRQSFDLGELVKVMPKINKALSKDGSKYEMSLLKGKVDKLIKSKTTPQEYAQWREANHQYSVMKQLTNKKFDKLLQKWGNGEVKANQFLKGMSKTEDPTSSILSNIREVVGSQQADKFEKLLMKDSIGDHFDDFALNKLVKEIDKNTLVTEEGKALQGYVKKVADVFRTDTEYRKLIEKNMADESGKSSDIFLKVATQAISKIYSLTFGKLSKDSRMKGNLINAIMKDKNVLKELDEVFSTRGKGFILQTISRSSDDALGSSRTPNEPTSPTKRSSSNSMSRTLGGVVGATVAGNATDFYIHTDNPIPKSVNKTDLLNLTNGNKDMIDDVYKTIASTTWAKQLNATITNTLQGTLTNPKKHLSTLLRSNLRSKGYKVDKAQVDKVISSYVDEAIENTNPRVIAKGKEVKLNSSDKEIMDNLLKHEVGSIKDVYNAQNPTSSAFGKYQVIDVTRNSIAKELGISKEFAKTPKGQELVMTKLFSEYKNNLNGLGQEVTPANIYTIHQLGYPRAKRFFTNTLTAKDYNILKSNIPRSKRKEANTKEKVLAMWEELYRA